MRSVLVAIRRASARLAVGFCCAAALASCTKNDSEQPATKGQVVARIGDQVVTIHELDNEFRLSNIPPAKDKDPEVIRKVLGDLVLRKYLVTRALDSKLDREPAVLFDLLRAREQVLATAFLNRAAAAKPPGKADIESYIADNPQKFDKRELFSVEQIVFPFNTSGESVVGANKDVTSLEEVEPKLREAGIPHVRQTGFINSSDLSLNLVQSMDARASDQVFFARGGANGVFFKVLKSESRPLVGQAAAELARQALRADALKAEAGVAGFSANMAAKYEPEYAKIMGKEEPSSAVK